MSVEKQKDYYEILGVANNAHRDEIQKAWRRLVRKNHPDVHPEDKRESFLKKIRDINKAWEILKDDKKRALYDKYGSKDLEEQEEPKEENISDIGEEYNAQNFCDKLQEALVPELTAKGNRILAAIHATAGRILALNKDSFLFTCETERMGLASLINRQDDLTAFIECFTKKYKDSPPPSNAKTNPLSVLVDMAECKIRMDFNQKKKEYWSPWCMTHSGKTMYSIFCEDGLEILMPPPLKKLLDRVNDCIDTVRQRKPYQGPMPSAQDVEDAAQSLPLLNARLGRFAAIHEKMQQAIRKLSISVSNATNAQYSIPEYQDGFSQSDVKDYAASLRALNTPPITELAEIKKFLSGLTPFKAAEMVLAEEQKPQITAAARRTGALKQNKLLAK